MSGDLCDPWRRLVAEPDSGRHALERPWRWESSIYASDGRAAYAAPAAPWHHVPVVPHDEPTCVISRLLAAREAAEPVVTPLVPLMLWAGPLPSPLAVVCDACSGTGSAGWREEVDGDWEPCALDGDAVRGAGTYCNNCDGDGWTPTPAEPVSVHGTLVDARRLARLLWAVIRLATCRGDGGELSLRALPDRLHVICDDAEALLIRMDPGRTRAERLWP